MTACVCVTELIMEHHPSQPTVNENIINQNVNIKILVGPEEIAQTWEPRVGIPALRNQAGILKHSHKEGGHRIAGAHWSLAQRRKHKSQAQRKRDSASKE